MKLISLSTFLLAASAVSAATWDFKDGNVKIKPKKGEVKTQVFSSVKASTLPLDVRATDSIIVSLTPEVAGKLGKPHQAMLMLRDVETGLEAPFGFTVRESGKSVAKFTYRDIPAPLLKAAKLEANIILGSFGSDKPLKKHAFFLVPQSVDKSEPLVLPERYEKKPEIHHVFRPDAQSPPVVISLAFVLAVVATVPGLFGAWLFQGANISYLPKAFASAPIAHGVFLGSIIAMEGVFFMYYTSWNLFQVLPLMGIVGTAAVLSGSRALGEVQARRLVGER